MISRFLSDFERMVRAVLPELKFFGVYRYRVVTKSGTDRWNLQVVSSTTGLPDVLPLSVKPGAAGVKADIALGSIVLVTFIEGDKGQPVITHFAGAGESGWKPVDTEIDGTGAVTIGASSTFVELGHSPRMGVARLGDAIQAGPFAGTITFASTRVKAGL